MPSKKPPNLFDPTPWLAYSQSQSTTAPPTTPSLTAASRTSTRAPPQPKILANAIKTITKTTTTKTSTYHLGSLIKTKEVTKERKTEYFQPEEFPPLADVNKFPDVAAKDATDSFCHAEQFAENFASGDVKVEERLSSCGTSTTMSLEHSNGVDDGDVSVELPSPYSGDEESEVSSRHRSFNVTVDHVAMSDTPRPGAPKAAPPRSPLADVDSTDSSSSSSSSCPSLMVPKHTASSDEAAASQTGELVDTTVSNASIASPPSPGRLLEPPHRGSALEESVASPDPRSDYYAHHALDAALSQSADLLSSASGSSPTNSTFDFQNFQTTALRELEETLSATGAIEESSLSIISGSSSRNFHRGEESALRDITSQPDTYHPYGENSSATFLGSPPCCSPGSIQASEDASGGGCRIGCFGEGSPGLRTASAAEVESESAGVSLRERVRDLLDNIALQVSGSGAATGTPTPPGTTRGGSPPSGEA